jgi:hypothetical protein
MVVPSMSAIDSEPHVSGAMVLQHLAVLEEWLGRAAVRAACDELPEAQRSAVQALTAVGWLPVVALEALYGAVARRDGRSVEAVHSEVARESVLRTLKTSWRMLLRMTGDSALVSRAPVLYQRTYSRGSLVAQIREPGRAELVLRGWPGVPELSQRGLRIGIGTVLEAAGRKGVKVISMPRVDGALIRATWIA